MNIYFFYRLASRADKAAFNHRDHARSQEVQMVRNDKRKGLRDVDYKK